MVDYTPFFFSVFFPPLLYVLLSVWERESVCLCVFLCVGWFWEKVERERERGVCVMRWDETMWWCEMRWDEMKMRYVMCFWSKKLRKFGGKEHTCSFHAFCAFHWIARQKKDHVTLPYCLLPCCRRDAILSLSLSPCLLYKRIIHPPTDTENTHTHICMYIPSTYISSNSQHTHTHTQGEKGISELCHITTHTHIHTHPLYAYIE